MALLVFVLGLLLLYLGFTQRVGPVTKQLFGTVKGQQQ